MISVLKKVDGLWLCFESPSHLHAMVPVKKLMVRGSDRSIINKAIVDTCEECASKTRESAPSASTNSAMDAIAALKNLVSAIDTYNSNPEYVHALWVRECNELSHARSVLQQHQ